MPITLRPPVKRKPTTGPHVVRPFNVNAPAAPEPIPCPNHKATIGVIEAFRVRLECAAGKAYSYADALALAVVEWQQQEPQRGVPA